MSYFNVYEVTLSVTNMKNFVVAEDTEEDANELVDGLYKGEITEKFYKSVADWKDARFGDGNSKWQFTIHVKTQKTEEITASDKEKARKRAHDMYTGQTQINSINQIN